MSEKDLKSQYTVPDSDAAGTHEDELTRGKKIFSGEEHLVQPGKAEKKKKKKKSGEINVVRVRLTTIAVMLGLVIVGGLFGLKYINQVKAGEAEISEGVKSSLKSIANNTEIMQYAKGMKNDLKQVLECIKAKDVDGAEAAELSMKKNLAELKKCLDPDSLTAKALGAVAGSQLESANKLIDIAERGTADLLDPMIALMKQYPLTELKVDGGFNTTLMIEYIAFLEKSLPEIEQIIGELNSVDVSLFDTDGKIAEYTEKITNLYNTYSPYIEYLPPIKALLGGGEDRLYIFAAQNSAEIRSSGGFPGACGTIRIKDGVLKISDFTSCYNMFYFNAPYTAYVTDLENKLFNHKLEATWDSDFCPDFERVAEIWTLGYEDRNGEMPDGVISATPVIIQRLLSFLGSITLSDGTELNGENATKFLEHDVYFKYLSDSSQASADYVDQLFAETAKTTLSLLMSTFDFGHLTDYLAFFLESVADRTLMVYLRDEEEQQLIRDAGWAATLNNDPMNPELGVFVSSCAASKMGWFLDIDTQIGTPTENGDGTKSYDCSITFSNAISFEEACTGGFYIIGMYNGGINVYYYIIAPAGATIDYVSSTGYKGIARETYEGHNIAYMLDETVWYNSTVTINIGITTAPGANDMGYMQTPTMTAYR